MDIVNARTLRPYGRTGTDEGALSRCAGNGEREVQYRDAEFAA